MCLKLKCFGYSCKKAWRGEGREKEKAGEMFFLFVCFFFCLFLFLFFVVVFFWGGGGMEEGRRGIF